MTDTAGREYSWRPSKHSASHPHPVVIILLFPHIEEATKARQERPTQGGGLSRPLLPPAGKTEEDYWEVMESPSRSPPHSCPCSHPPRTF